MSPRSLPPAILASTVALAVVAGPLAVSAYARDGGNGDNSANSGNGSFLSGTDLPPKSPIEDDEDKDEKDPKGPKGPRDPKGPKGPDEELEGSYEGELITTLTLEMNRARQAEITQEIMEVVAGAEAI